MSAAPFAPVTAPITLASHVSHLPPIPLPQSARGAGERLWFLLGGRLRDSSCDNASLDVREDSVTGTNDGFGPLARAGLGL